MKIAENENLSKHTTVRIGGIAKKYFMPESVEELMEVMEKENPQYFIGGGSNLLIAERTFDKVVDLRSFDKTISFLGDGTFRVGASVRLQKLITSINEMGYGGIEYLYSVPGLVGGAVVMNAGRKKSLNQTISDYIISVSVIREGKIQEIPKEQCGFEHRNSIFKNGSDLIVSVCFCFPEMLKEESKMRIEERLALCKAQQDSTGTNFGTVFLECNSRIMKFVKKQKTGGKKVHFSGKRTNWLVNEGGSFEDALKAIKKVEVYHRILFKKCKKEVIIWK